MSAPAPAQTVRILSIPFFNGSPAEAVAAMNRAGGLLVAPSGTCFERLLDDRDYRRAVTTADVALPDSGFMVLLWRYLRGGSIPRISGLAYLRTLFADTEFRKFETLWVLPHERALAKLIAWGSEAGVTIERENCYLAPMYGPSIEDQTVVELLRARRPVHVVIAIGAGPQERLGWYLREHAGYKVAIHCTGGALGFITGDQVAIPGWADRLYLGWCFRLMTQPRVFVPRLWKGRLLPWLITRYGAELPG